MNYIKCTILILFLLTLAIDPTISQTPINLDGPAGLSLLNSLTQSHVNQNNSSLDETNYTANLNGTNDTSSSDFWSWGTGPKSHTVYYNRSVNSSVENSPSDPLAMTSDLKDLNDLAEKNSFATA